LARFLETHPISTEVCCTSMASPLLLPPQARWDRIPVKLSVIPPHPHVLSSPGRDMDKWLFQISLTLSVPGNLSARHSPPSPWACRGTEQHERCRGHPGRDGGFPWGCLRMLSRETKAGMALGKVLSLVKSCCIFAPFSCGRHHPPCQEKPP